MIGCKRIASSLDLIGCLTSTVDKKNANRINSRWQSREETISDKIILQSQAPSLWSRMNYHGWARWQIENWVDDHQMVLHIVPLFIWLSSQIRFLVLTQGLHKECTSNTIPIFIINRQNIIWMQGRFNFSLASYLVYTITIYIPFFYKNKNI